MTFDAFYGAYPRKVGKGHAIKAWAKLSDPDRTQALKALPDHIRWWRQHGTETVFIPHPASWLNGLRMWDELVFDEPKAQVAWWTSDKGVQDKARELGLSARPGEEWAQFKARVVDAVRRAA